ncbi:MAG: DUF6694 family lipoprotein [Victivallis sp.]
MKRVILLVATMMLLAGCGRDTLNGSSEDAFKSSLQKMTQKLSEDDRKKVAATITMMIMQETGPAALQGKAVDMNEVCKKFDGMTLSDIMKKYDEFQERFRAK